ncbi:very-long-chain 3-oxoacyl-CoA synthase [Malassezia cuniculi]|uniref:Elongation of fatty acids protein n=1 Tax=Malassezia cuniculi TaxID=948313 RepID=A0AAF0J765_9BASI|nr:very-long-chain 3-oxoacyl-CoA synthase [Malassezia cuniculi]
MSLFDTLSSATPAQVKEFLEPLASWRAGYTPIATWTSVFTASFTYLALVLGGQAVMNRLPAVPASVTKWPSVVHNVALSFGSLVLLVLMLEEVLQLSQVTGPFGAICSQYMYSARMEQLYIVNYYFKFWEFLDTFFLVIKKKPLMFLHVYHHMATAVLCFIEIQYQTPMSWVVITLNLAVHVVMYAYYALTTLRIPCPWKRYITVFQIVQFVIDVFICCFATYNHYIYVNWPWLPHVGDCEGKPMGAWSGIGILMSYLVLFLLFYRNTYTKSKAKTA